MKKIVILLLCTVVAAQSRQEQRQKMLADINKGSTLAWSKHYTGQDVNDLTSFDKFELVAVIPGENSENECWVVVQRTIDGNSVRYIEQFQPVRFADQNSAWFVDCAPSSGVTGADVPEVLGDYPTLRTTTDQADLGLIKGTPISNLTELQDMRDDLTDNYYLINDIDASGSTSLDSGQGFEPIGKNVLNRFTGTFDGNGYTITGLFINRRSSYLGLFGWVEGTAKIANVTMASVDITGEKNLGAVVGEMSATATDEPVLQNCSASGAIKGHPSESPFNVGGLIGFADGDDGNSKRVFIYDCDTSCTVDENSSLVTDDFGGFIGLATFTTIKNCFATGNVDGTDTANVGGFVGTTTQGTTISYCYATGDVIAEVGGGGFVGGMENAADTIIKCYATGDITNTENTNQNFGGFVGTNVGGDITDCYAWGDVSSTQSGSEVGGFIGEDSTGSATFTNCYSIGLVTGESIPGGFIGNGSSNTFTDVYWDTDTSGTAVSDGGTGQTTTWLKTNPNYPSGWDFDTIWFQDYTAAISIPSTSFSGLKHLIGESVCVYADGEPIGSFVVDGNGVIAIGSAYTTVLAGLNYYSIYESFPLIAGEGDVSSKTRNTTIQKVSIDIFETLGLNLGTDLDHSSEIQFTYDSMFTGFKQVSFPRGTRRSPVVHLWIWEPVSCTIRGIYIDEEIIIP